ncbi:glucose PTS transporter subunit EIIB [Conservatibacter flavescens]|uniref:PTS EIIB type-1 domain-containing protein n=1 Tax=Conservatibacter flavescens TaxID=28161 RepID=A0A2M8S311_9PAST|nr:PTS glucose/sucrose transporter subunit IIB [Conservatibacter flavescens]PJG85488.1 hypothetical protein CVP05_05670 [Conservatibacter flavescens]
MGLFKSKQVTDKQDKTNLSTLATDIITACGGKENINQVDSCITRLRLNINDVDKINYSAFEHLGAKGVVLSENNQLQLIYGTKAHLILEKLKTLI